LEQKRPIAHPAANQLIRPALDDGAAPDADVAIALPRTHGTYAGVRAAVGVLSIGIEFHKRISHVELVVVVHAVDILKIETELGWTPKYSFESGLRETVRWYLEDQKWVGEVLEDKKRKAGSGTTP
jgi:hypothetical protein